MVYLSKDLGCLLFLSSAFYDFHHTDPILIFVRFILKYFIFFGAIYKACLLQGEYLNRDLSEARTWSEHECKGPETGACFMYVKNSKKNGTFEVE